MDVDQASEAELSGEGVWASERLGREHRQVFDVGRLSLTEQGSQHGVGQDAAVERLLQAVQSFPASGQLIEIGSAHGSQPATQAPVAVTTAESSYDDST